VVAGSLLRMPLGVRTRVGWPAALMAIVAVASAASLLPTRLALEPAWPTSLLTLARDYALGATDLRVPIWRPIIAAMIVVETALLAWCAEAVLRQRPAQARATVWLSLAGQAGAAVLNVNRILASVLRSGDAAAVLWPALARARVSMQTDVNAAASGFVLVAASGAGLLSRAWLANAAVAGLLVLTTIGVWTTGSRAALAALGAAVLMAGVALTAARSPRVRRVIVGAVVVAAVAAFVWYPRGRNPTVSDSLQSRGALIGAGLQMFRQAPAFGIGIGQFFETSAEYVGDTLQKFNGYRHENAHNNFVQIAAEQGVVGLVALVFAVGTIMVAAWRSERLEPSTLRRGVMIGIAASMLTWMTGHPLLVREFASVFWLYVGILASLTVAPAALPERSRERVFAAAVAALLVVSVPWRAERTRDLADFEHAAIGLSLWQHDDTQRYRESGARSTLFLPATGDPVQVPVRRAPGVTTPLTVELRLRGALVASTRLDDDEWHVMALSLTAGRRRFEAVDVAFAAEPRAPDGIVARIGKATQTK